MIHRTNSNPAAYSIDAPQLLLPLVKAVVKVCLGGDKTKPLPPPPLTDSHYQLLTQELLLNNIRSPSKDKIEHKLESINSRFHDCTKALDYYTNILKQIDNPDEALSTLSSHTGKDSKDHWDLVCSLTSFYRTQTIHSVACFRTTSLITQSRIFHPHILYTKTPFRRRINRYRACRI